MHNHLLRERTARDIDGAVERVLRDLGDPEPPLRLVDVRELLKLDRAFYTTADTSLVRETVHYIKVAGVQVFKQPSRLIDAIKKCDLKALWLPDRRRILIDAALPDIKKRWGEAHEIGHSIIDWHEHVTHGDKLHTLSLSCELQTEAEANFAAGRMLFLRDRFSDELLSTPVTFKRVQELAGLFGNTMASTLWRAVEAMDIPAVGIVCIHPQDEPEEGKSAVRYFIRSRKFAAQFGNISDRTIFAALGTFCFRRRGPIGQKELVLPDVDGNEHVFYFDCFHNSHDTLALGLHRAAHPVMVSLPR